MDYKQNQLILLTLIISVTLIVLIVIQFILRKLKKSYKKLISKDVEHQRVYQKYLALIDEKTRLSNSNAKKKVSALSIDVQQDLLEKINAFMNKDKPYLDSNFQISNICEALEVNRSYVSQVINQVEKKNFSQFVNEFRIREACSIFNSDEGLNYSIEGVSLMVGFKSKTPFYKSFKDILGVTPAFYLKNI